MLGVTGGIAAYKTADLASKPVQAGYGVTVVMTESATCFVGPATSKLSQAGMPTLCFFLPTIIIVASILN
ncbi:MAG: flavoprotein [Planctomycetaceae bacterium]